MLALETSGLSYAFSGAEHVLRDVDLQVPVGSIYGFLGPNGAGKTTTLRLALGLLRRQEGSVRILGRSFPEHRLEILSRVGSLIETPSLYAHLTAEENLDLSRRIHRCERARIGEALELTGLTAAAHKKAGAFSLGMKQRLAIATALLHRPTLLILDEPTNGLDPHGIIEMRFPYFVNKKAPVSKVESLMDYDVTFIGESGKTGTTMTLKVVVPVTSLCPCSKEISDYGAHNQRSHVTLTAKLAPGPHFVWIEELIDLAEDVASCELYGLLKRPDEKFVTERAYDNPKFVEDLVRDAAHRLNKDSRIAHYVVESENFESIHNHSAYAMIEKNKGA